MFDCVAVGEILIDFTPAGFGRARAARFAQNMGGAPANVACALARLGRKTAFIGKAGNDGFGRFCAGELARSRVDTSGLVLSDSHNTTLAFVHLSPNGDRSFSFYRKNSADISLKESELDMGLLGSARICHFGGVSLTDEPSRSATLAAVKAAKRAGALVTYDPNYRPSLWESAEKAKEIMLGALPLADIVKLSEEEAEFFLGTGAGDIAGALREATGRFGAKLAFVTRGAKGAATVAQGRLICSGAYGVKTVDTTGAGDCFFGGALHCVLALCDGRAQSGQQSARSGQAFGRQGGQGGQGDQLAQGGQLAQRIARISAEEALHMLMFANAAGSMSTAKMGALAAQPSLAAVERCMEQEKELGAQPLMV
jgi:fructokinase